MQEALTIDIAKAPSEREACIFFLFEKEDVNKQPLAGFLNEEEKTYLKRVGKGLEIKEKGCRILLSPTLRKLIFVGLGKKETFSPKKAGLISRIALQAARREKIKEFAFFASSMGSPPKTRSFYESVAANFILANFDFTRYKTPPKDGFSYVSAIHAVLPKPNQIIEESINRGVTIGEETNNCRELSNTPGGDMTPKILAQHAVKDAKDLNIDVKILDENEIKKLGMGGVIGVSKGSSERPRFIIMEYYGAKKSQKPIVLVGKGVTFDTGGLNLKPTDSIYEMHMDMSGGSAVIHIVRLAARLKIKRNIIGLVPAVENMPSGSSYHPGDILKTMSGKTIEVLNTDAEGRIILADALEYAKKYKPTLVIDIATLTGSSMVALGKKYIGLFTPDKNLEEKLRSYGESSGESVWPLPMSPDFEDEIRGTFGDWANAGKGRYGDASNAAVFLWQFTKDAAGKSAYPWVHLDIAPRMTSSEGEYLSKGAVGAGVQLIAKLLENF